MNKGRVCDKKRFLAIAKMPNFFAPTREPQKATGTNGKKLPENLAFLKGQHSKTTDFDGQTLGSSVDCNASEKTATVVERVGSQTKKQDIGTCACSSIG